MQVIIADSPEEVACLGADEICRLLARKRAAILGLATGSTPIAMYQVLIELHRKNRVSFKDVKTFNLDEYAGLAPDHPQSYRTFMNQQLFNEIDIVLGNTYIPYAGSFPDAEALAYENKIQQEGGIDLQVLGLGRNGHIGFNEPSSSLASRTRVKTLTAETVADNSHYFEFEEFQPRLAITMGIGTIMEAREVMLLATGSAKADAVKKMVEGPLSASCPASVLQLHPHALIVVDKEAGSQLSNPEYYHRVRLETNRLNIQKEEGGWMGQ